MRENLKKHMYTIHEGNKDFQCFTCDLSFSQLPALKNHISVHHQKNKAHKNKCNCCGKSFSDLKTHINLVHEAWHMDKDHKCEICEKSFRNPSDLSNHILTTHDCRKNEKCNICGKFFCTKCDLKKHINSVHEFRCK